MRWRRCHPKCVRPRSGSELLDGKRSWRFLYQLQRPESSARSSWVSGALSARRWRSRCSPAMPTSSVGRSFLRPTRWQLLANKFPEADTIEVGALMYAALILLGITLLVNVVGTLILQRADASLQGLR